MGTINRNGVVHFNDASFHVWEEGIAEARKNDGIDAAAEWERNFKRDVFARIIQQLRRLGWECRLPVIDPHDVKHYGGNVARWSAERKRVCFKGDLKADLQISGRHIEFKMFQSINCPTRPDHEGRYESNKEGVMPYVMRLEMERTRRRIRDYLCAVMEGYTFDDKKRGIYRKPLEATAIQCIEQHYAESWHFKGDWPTYLAANNGLPYNRKSADGVMLDHGQHVWFFDHKGRCCSGTALYNINNMWWVVTGKYDYTNKASFDLYTACPENPRIKRNDRQRRKRIEAELANSIKAMNFERAAILRDILFAKGAPLFMVYHQEHGVYHGPGFSGYTADTAQAGKFTADEVKGWDRPPNRVLPVAAGVPA